MYLPRISDGEKGNKIYKGNSENSPKFPKMIERKQV